MASVIVDLSWYHSNYNHLPPETGTYYFSIGNIELTASGTFKEAKDSARRTAREIGVYRVVLTHTNSDY